MPVLTYRPYPTVSPTTQGTPYQSGEGATPNAFGAGIGAALGQVGQAFGQAGDVIAKHVVEQQEQFNKTAADEQINQAIDRVNKLRFGDPDKEGDVGFHGLIGRAAMEGYRPYRQNLDSVIGEHRAWLTPVQQQRFDERMRTVRTHALEQGAEHYSSAFKDYRRKEFDSSLVLSAGNVQAAAAEGNSVAFDKYVADDAKLIDDNPDLTPTQKEAEKLKRKKEHYKDRANGLASRGDYEGADAFVDANPDALGDYGPQLKNSFRAHRERAEAGRGVASILGGGGGGGGGGSSRATGLVPYTPSSDILTGTGLTGDQYQTFRSHLASRESGSYAQSPNTGGYSGRYQFGRDEIRETAKRLGVPVPSQQEFLGNPQLQERFLENYTLDHHNSLMAKSEAYRNAAPNQKAAYLMGAHLGGVGGMLAYLESDGKVDRADSNGTRISNYVASMRSALGGSAPAAPAAPSPPTPAAAGGETPITNVGDSLAAHPIRAKLARGQESGKLGVYNKGDTAVSGWGPAQILSKVIPNIPDEVIKGQVVNLSSGASNNPGELDSIPEQIKLLKKRGAANVVLMGVGSRPDLAPLNEKLAQIAKDNGIPFAGPLRAPRTNDRVDKGVHSSDQPAEMAAVRQALGGAAAVPSPAAPEPATGSSAPPPGTTMAPNPFAEQPGQGNAPAPVTNLTAAPPAAAAAAAAPAPGRPPVANLDANIAEVERRFAAGQISSREVADHMITELTHEYNKWQHQTAQERTALGKEITDGAAALADGKPWTVPVDRITRLLPPEKAAEKLEELEDARTAGGYKSTVRTSSPQDIAAQRARLAEGTDDPTANNYARRSKLLKIYDEVVKHHTTELLKDPGNYVKTYSPLVAAAYQTAFPATASGEPTLNPADPAAFAVYAHATLDEQARLGVPERKRALLPEGQAANLTEEITRIDPTKTDPAQKMASLAQSYGSGQGTNDHWPRVFGELVKAKLPGAYQVLANMDRPDQKVAAADLSRSLGVIAQKGGMAVVKAGAGEERKDADKEVTSALEDFRLSTVPQDAGQDLYKRVEEATQALAYYYAYRGESASKAAEHAVAGIVGNKYDFGSFGANTVRVPKNGDQNMVGTTQRAADQLQREIVDNPQLLGPIPGLQYRTANERNALWREAIANGGWANNRDDTGIVLTATLKNGGVVPVRRADGTPVVLMFRDAPAIAETPSVTIQGPAINNLGAFRWPWQAAPAAPVGSGSP